MRIGTVVFALVALFAQMTPVRGEAFSSCWVSQEADAIRMNVRQVTRCRIAGGNVIDYASDSDVPSQLYPQTGTDLTGQCWYYTSAPTQYLIINQYANGDIDIGYDADPSNPGVSIALGPRLPRCSTEPSPATDPQADAWEYVMQYIHKPPVPDLSPRPGEGVTGMATYVGVPIPGDHNAQLNSGGVTLDVFIEVSAVVVGWGDGQTDVYPASETALSGYPNGFATHQYETKGDNFNLGVSYDWTARWRVDGGAWSFLSVPNTTTTVGYPVAEIVAHLDG